MTSSDQPSQTAWCSSTSKACSASATAQEGAEQGSAGEVEGLEAGCEAAQLGAGRFRRETRQVHQGERVEASQETGSTTGQDRLDRRRNGVRSTS